MKFYLFSRIEFEIPAPISIIECYCYQSDFYSKYDVIENRKIEDINKIGARLKSTTISKCKVILEATSKLEIFQHTLDQFLNLDRQEREKQIKELNDVVFQELFKIKGIRFSTATKFLHTIYPEIIPMIDNPLQRKYKKEINHSWNYKNADEILMDFYDNLENGDIRKNLNEVSTELTKNNIKHLTKIRIFDILWWSYLKAEKLKNERGIKWTSIH
ncbi:MAG: hypothetical protein KBI07_02800 [Candidatus Atribacteria bacterium]|nr:hypothetical protein [Candidatus Atribacteria bacterium]